MPALNACLIPRVSLIALNRSVMQADDPLAAAGDAGVVRHHQDRPPVPRQFVEQRQHLLAGLAVERAGGLVSQNDERVVDQRAGDADALLLAAGELGGAMI